MSREYPCVYYENRRCLKYSDDEAISFCVEGPCSDETPSNADHIRIMSDEELAQFIYELACCREAPWRRPFYKANCESCQPIIGRVEGDDSDTEFRECDFVDGKCPHGSDILWWLQQPTEEE